MCWFSLTAEPLGSHPQEVNCQVVTMKIAVGIIALVLSMVALMQFCTITGLSGITNDSAVGEAGT